MWQLHPTCYLDQRKISKGSGGFGAVLRPSNLITRVRTRLYFHLMDLIFSEILYFYLHWFKNLLCLLELVLEI